MAPCSSHQHWAGRGRSREERTASLRDNKECKEQMFSRLSSQAVPRVLHQFKCYCLLYSALCKHRLQFLTSWDQQCFFLLCTLPVASSNKLPVFNAAPLLAAVNSKECWSLTVRVLESCWLKKAPSHSLVLCFILAESAYI